MGNESLVRIKGKPNTKSEGKYGTVQKMRLYDIHGKPLPLRPDIPVLVLWDGEKEKEFVILGEIEIIE